MAYFYNNGHKLYYREKGTGNLLFILPGNTASSANYLDELDYFSEYFHTVSLDFWGTGNSDRLKNWNRSWWLEAANDTVSLVEHLNHHTANIIGCSGGAAVGLLAAALYPGKIRAVIADSELDQYHNDLIKLCIEERNCPSKEQVDFWQQAHGADWEDIVKEDNILMLDLCRNGHIFKDKLQNITCSVLFCGSLESDRFVPNFSDSIIKMAKEVHKAELFLINDGNHPLMWTCKDQFRRIALSFLEIHNKS